MLALGYVLGLSLLIIKVGTYHINLIMFLNVRMTIVHCFVSLVWLGNSCGLDTRLVHVKYLVLALVNITLDEMCIVIQTLHPHLLGVFVVCHWTKIKSKHILYLSLLPSLT